MIRDLERLTAHCRDNGSLQVLLLDALGKLSLDSPSK